MNMKSTINTLPICLMAVAAMALSTVTAVQAQSNLEARIVLRPLSAVDVKTYSLPSTNSDLSGGLDTIGVGTPAYLEVEVNTNFPESNIVNVVWTITSKPIGSAAMLTTSPLGTNVPIYEPSDRLAYQVAGQATGNTYGRMVLRPDITGSALLAEHYTVQATVTTTTGTTNLTQNITAGTYIGSGNCFLCHSPGAVATNMWGPWSQTLHAQIFSDEIDGLLGSSVSQSCLQCHTTGYSANTNVADGGFSALAAQYKWTIPAVLTNGNWAAMQTNYPLVALLANVQCESCHGPGSQHAGLYGNTNTAGWPGLSISYISGDCNQCHDDATHHPYGTEWLNSVHAVTTTIPAAEAAANPASDTICVSCHTATGFIDRINGVTNNIDLTYMPINCQACHEPHGITIPTNGVHMIRTMAAVTLIDGTVVTNAGEGALCMECHQSRMLATTAATTRGSAYFGPHEGPQADMLEGVNGFTYGQSIPSSAHASAVSNTCVTCHMQILAISDPALTHAGGHTFEMSWNNDDLVGACQQCHGSITAFDFPVENFDGDGATEGVQTQIQNLLNELSELLPPVGTIKTSLSINSGWNPQQLEAAYNWLFVEKDGSLGVHNTAYAAGLLQASIANLTGNANVTPLTTNDIAYYEWATNYFSSISAAGAGPDDVNNVNGIPNWMMYLLGLNPTQSGISVTNGVVYADGKNLVNPPISPGLTNTIEIYTAAEVAFNTQTNETYTIQAASSLSSGWQNISTNIVGTGAPYSYLTPTRNNVQMFFRVLHTP
ncbi:MAG: multiheme c-type cytochrome [Verrucomicrobiia bacterium]